MNSPDFRRRLRKLWLLLLALAAAAYLAFRADELLQGFRPPGQVIGSLLGATVLLQGFYWLVASITWRSLLARYPGIRLGVLDALQQLAAVNIGKYLPGKVWGIIARGGQLYRRGVSPAQALAVTLIEQYLLLVAAALTALLLSPAWQSAIPVPAAILGSALLIWIGWRAQAPGLRLLARLATEKDDVPRRDGLNGMVYAGFLAAFVCLWTVNGLVLSALYFSLFAATPDLHQLLVLIMANTVGITIGFIAVFSPGGIGVREGVTAALLLSIMPLDDALVLGVAYRLWLIVWDALFAIFLLWREGRLITLRP